MSQEPARLAAEAVARRSYGKLVAYLAARTRDVAGAEDALSEAFAAALADWPASGIPRAPEAWLLKAARCRLPAAEPAAEFEIPDDRLRLMFACAHPAIDAGVRAPLILQTILGFDVVTIASAFLVSPTAMAQRLVRAKSRIRLAGIPFRVPEMDNLRERLDAVLEAIYAAYAEGWSDPAGTAARRHQLSEEGIWLGRLVATLLPDEPEALGLVALMLHVEARRDAAGDDLPLDEQDPAAWNGALIDEAEALLLRASRLGAIGRFQLEAAVQSAHAARRRNGRTDWAAIERLYDALLAITASPVVAINRAIARAETQGPAEGLAALDALVADTRLLDYQPYWAARAALLAKSGRGADAAQAYRRAVGLESDPAVRRFLQRRLAELAS